MQKALFLILLTYILSTNVQADRLNDIQSAGILRVGTTGDYKPFSFYNGNYYSGYDIDVAKYFSEQLGVELLFIKTNWKKLIPDLKQNKFDIAMGGITKKIQRQLHAEQTLGYMVFGKCFLVASNRASQFNSIAKVNTATVKVGVNIGGTNELFADANLASANITRFKNNLEIPLAVASGKVDVMVTETPEALYYQTINNKLETASCDVPFTKSQFGYLVQSNEQRLLNTINFMMEEMKLKGLDIELMKKHSLK